MSQNVKIKFEKLTITISAFNLKGGKCICECFLCKVIETMNVFSECDWIIIMDYRKDEDLKTKVSFSQTFKHGQTNI